jgi:uncharacterized protein
MIGRFAEMPTSNSFFLFGPRGSGKSTLLKSIFKNDAFWIDLLDDMLLDKYSLNPQELKQELQADSKKKTRWVVIDEVQKCPKLLNTVHQIIEDPSFNVLFALTGSSSRRLKQKGVNLLAGRAFVEHLFPFSHFELPESFDLDTILRWGTLPKLWELKEDAEKADYLRAYSLTYIRTEIQEEQWVRKIDPFRRFIAVAAQMNGSLVNYANIARDVGVDPVTVQSYYEILEDTLMGFYLPAYNRSIRKQQRKAPKFYLFDCGIVRALQRVLNIDIAPQTYEYGKLFEQFVVLEVSRINHYLKRDYELSYLLTKDNVEIDLIIDRPGEPTALVEIKSKQHVDDRDTHHLKSIAKDIDKAECFLLSQDSAPKVIDGVNALPWKQGLQTLFSHSLREGSA